MEVFVDYIRATSNFHNQTDANSREAAVIKALNKIIGIGNIQDSVEIGNLPGGIWPVLGPYANDNSGGEGSIFPHVPPPAFIWDDLTMEPGETRYFAQAIPLLRGSNADYVVFIVTFADDAHRLFLEERTRTGELVNTFTVSSEGMIDGNMSPTASAGELCPPFNWQRIHFWSRNEIIPQSGDNFLVLSYEVVNYNSIGPVNPAGLAFVMDMYAKIFVEDGE